MNLFLIVLIAIGVAIILPQQVREVSFKTFISKEEIESDIMPSGSALADCLSLKGLPDTIVNIVVKTFSETFNPRDCKAGAKYEIARNKKGEFLYFRYWADPTNYYTVEKISADSYTVKKESLKLKKEIVGTKGEIKTSLWESAIGDSIPPEVIVSVTDIFAWQIDFLTEPRKGDMYMLIWEKYKGENGFRKEGKILAAMYRGKEVGTQVGILFKDHYYSPEGKSMQKQFLRAPLSYRRISSYFTLHRFHPILKYFRPHLGIDYAAGYGTPVSTIGDGVVEFAGWKGANGKLVIIRHNATYTSSYGHLSGFGKGVHGGARVSQGQVIGYVGATGLATGPHLDFRVKKYGSFINYLKMEFPPMESVKKEEMPEFGKIKREALELLAKVKQNKKGVMEVAR